MKLIAITYPHFFPGEGDAIMRLLDGEFDRVHIRKPFAAKTQLSTFLDTIDPQYYGKLSLHDCFTLALERSLGGIHLNRRNSICPEGWTGLKSKSCHSIDEIRQQDGLDYMFLSPVFDSISKRGYKAAFDFDELKDVLKNHKNVFALGGVTRNKLPQLADCGFQGAVMLTDAWGKIDLLG